MKTRLKFTNQEIIFMQEFINIRLILNETGNVSISEQKVCYIFHKILKELEGSDGNEQSGIKGFN